MLLGVDAGGTSTRAVLVDRTGRCLGFGTAGGGNPVSWGVDRAAAEIAAAARSAIAQAALPSPAGRAVGPDGDGPAAGGDGAAGDRPGVAVLAMAGGSAFGGAREIGEALAAAGLNVSVTVASDLLATFCSGTAALDGYALVAGTGAAAIRVRDGRVDRSVDGLGWLLGDAGSGFWIGRRVVRAALAAVDGRGPATALTEMVVQRLGIGATGVGAEGRPAELQAAVDVLYRRRPVELSQLADLAFRAAAPHDGSGDAVAAAILGAARDRLITTLSAARADGVTGPVVLGGGVARRLPGLAAAITGASGAAPCRVLTVTDGAVGAGVLALRRAGVRVDGAAFTRLAESVARLR